MLLLLLRHQIVHQEAKSQKIDGADARAKTAAERGRIVSLSVTFQLPFPVAC